MSKAVIYIYSDGEDGCDLSFEFDPPLGEDFDFRNDPPTHQLAMQMLDAIQDGIVSVKAGDSEKELWDD